MISSFSLLDRSTLGQDCGVCFLPGVPNIGSSTELAPRNAAAPAPLRILRRDITGGTVQAYSDPACKIELVRKLTMDWI